MELTDTPAEQAFRAEARAWLEANVPQGLPSGDTREGFAAHLEWEKKLYENRWAVVSWPEAYGGRDASIWEWIIFEEEYYRARAPQRVTQNGIFLLAPTIFDFGSQEQQDVLLPRMAAAEDLWGQGWSEPGSGSDLASLRSRATRDDERGGWVLNGQKTWTTRGAFCTHVFGLFRTNPDETRHRGLSYFVVPLDIPGITVRGFERLDGDEGFAEVFFEDAFISDDLAPYGLLGEVDKGWSVAMATTGSERGLTLRSPGRFRAAAENLLQLATDNPALTDVIRDRVVGSWMDAEAYHMFTMNQVTDLVEGREPGARSSLNKVFWSDLDIRLHEAALELLGPDAYADHSWSRGFQFSLSGPIYAGTNEIQRNIIAERVLGLPKA